MKRKLKLLSISLATLATAGGLATGLVVGLDKPAVASPQADASTKLRQNAIEKPYSDYDNIQYAGFANYTANPDGSTVIGRLQLHDYATKARRFLYNLTGPSYWGDDPDIQIVYQGTDSTKWYKWSDMTVSASDDDYTYQLGGTLPQRRPYQEGDKLVFNFRRHRVYAPAFREWDEYQSVVYTLTTKSLYTNIDQTNVSDVPVLPTNFKGDVVIDAPLTINLQDKSSGLDADTVAAGDPSTFKLAPNLAYNLDVGFNYLPQLGTDQWWNPVPVVRYEKPDGSSVPQSFTEIKTPSGRLAKYWRTTGAFENFDTGHLVYTYFVKAKDKALSGKSYDVRFQLVRPTLAQGQDVTVTYDKPLNAGLAGIYDVQARPQLTPPSVNTGYLPNWSRDALQIVKPNGWVYSYSAHSFIWNTVDVGDVIVDTYTAVPAPGSGLQPYRYVARYEVKAKGLPGVVDGSSEAAGLSQPATASLNVPLTPDLTLNKLVSDGLAGLNSLSALYENARLDSVVSSTSYDSASLLAGADQPLKNASETYTLTFKADATRLNYFYGSSLKYRLVVNVVAPRYVISDNLSLAGGLSSGLNADFALDNGYTDASVFSYTALNSDGSFSRLKSLSDLHNDGKVAEVDTTYSVTGPGLAPYYVRVVSKNHGYDFDSGTLQLSESNVQGTADKIDKLNLPKVDYYRPWVLDSLAVWDQARLLKAPVSSADALELNEGSLLFLKFTAQALTGGPKLVYDVTYRVTGPSVVVVQPQKVVSDIGDGDVSTEPVGPVAPTEPVTPPETQPTTPADQVSLTIDDPLSWIKGVSTETGVNVPLQPGYDQKRLVSLTYKNKDNHWPLDITNDPLSASLGEGGTVESLYEVSGPNLPSYKVLVTSLVHAASEANGFINVEARNVSGPLGRYGAPDLVLPKLPADYSQQWYVNGMFEYDRFSGQLLPITANQLWTRGSGYSFIVRYVAPKNSYGPGYLYTVHYTLA